MMNEFKDGIVDDNCIHEECVTEEAVVYDEQIMEGFKEVEVEQEIDDENEDDECELNDDLDEESDDSDEKEMVVDENDDNDENDKDGNSADSEADSESENDDEEQHSDSDSKAGLTQSLVSDDIYEHNNESFEASDSSEHRANSSLVGSRFEDRESYIIHQPNDSWAHFTGLKVKHFNSSELEAFKKPFEMGWRREVVLRGTVTNSGKKIGDVYYFSPDKRVKLRSYVEMGLYLKKHQNCDLEPENFTFARQPIYKAPEEIVRHAMQRGGSHNQFQASLVDSSVVPSNANVVSYPTIHSTSRSTKSVNSASDSGTEDKSGISSVAEGRAKRKRVAPSRFEDEDYSEQSPFKKKTKLGALLSAGTPILPPAVNAKTPHMKVTLANK
ncbi:ras-related protein Rab-1A-like protein, partial [Leptotrombidium deliense]